MTASKITHVYDESLGSNERMRICARVAAEFLNEDTEPDFPVHATWSLNGRSKELDPANRSPFSESGPISLQLRDEELGVGASGYLRTQDIEGDSRYWIRKLWQKLLWARTEKLHELVFHSENPGESN